jgi:saccharopine dehydrogenase-like NADP-dependent oxidoreductase
MKHILLIGAGKSATVLINYLKDLVFEKQWHLTVADTNLVLAVSKVGNHPNAKAVALNIENEKERNELIQQADIVISMMPPAFHYLVALDCIQFNKNLLTASYVDEKIKNQAAAIKEKGLLFLCEMGLDPGIDHMSAMQMIHQIEKKGGVITSFKSHCGGLIAPECDNNPWHYKISWNPKNIINAGKAGAVFKMNNEIKTVPYEKLFDPKNTVAVNDKEVYAFYPNRDSLQYMKLYGLQNAATFIRTTLRHPEFSFGWKNVIDLKLTDEEKIYETDGLSIADFFHIHFEKNGFSEWLNDLLRSKLNDAKFMVEKIIALMETEQELKEEGEAIDDEMLVVDENGNLNSLNIEDVKDKAAETMAAKMYEANLSMKQLFFLGLDDEETIINKGLCSAADILQFILEKKWALEPDDKDLVVMLHEIEYEVNGKKKKVRSELIVTGENSLCTAMATTVGLPLGIAAKLILEGKMNETGLHIPVIASIYEPVLDELKKMGVAFKEI